MVPSRSKQNVVTQCLQARRVSRMRPVWGPAPSCYIVAEIGINHNGDLDIARRLIDLAADTGCDAVKFQKRTLDVVYPPEVLDSPRESPWGTTQRDQKEALEFGREEYDQ